MYNFLLVNEKFSDNNYGYSLLFKTSGIKDIAIGYKVVYEDKLYKIIDVDTVYKKINNIVIIKEVNVYVEDIGI